MCNSYRKIVYESSLWGSMQTSDITLEIVDILCRRKEILTRLDRESSDKRTLVDDLEIPRSTLDRAIRELEAIDLVTYTGGEFTVTSVGKRLVQDFDAFLDRAELTLEFEPFLQWVSVDEFDLDPRILDEVDLLVPETANPYAVIDRHVQRLANTERARELLPLTGLYTHETTHERILKHRVEVELVVESGVMDIMCSDPSFAELTDEMVASDRFELYVYEGNIPYSVGVFDDEIVQIRVDDDGEPQTLIETDKQAVRTWAHETIDDYKQQATPLSRTALQSRPSM